MIKTLTLTLLLASGLAPAMATDSPSTPVAPQPGASPSPVSEGAVQSTPVTTPETQSEAVPNPEEMEAHYQAAFLKAQQARRRGDVKALEQLSEALKGYVLEDYVEYWRLYYALKKAPNEAENRQALLDFIRSQKGTYVGERATVDYLLLLNKKLDKAQFNSLYASLVWNQDDTTLRGWYYVLNLAPKTPSLYADAKGFMLTRPVKGEVLVALAQRMIELKPSDTDEIFKIIAQQRRWTSLRQLTESLPKKRVPMNAARLKSLLHNPVAYDKKYGRRAKGFELEMLTLRLLRTDDDRAAERLTQNRTYLSRERRGLLWAALCHESASELNAKAPEYCRKALFTHPLLANKDDVLAWTARAYMRAGHWTSLKNTLLAMSPAQRHEETWTYWYGVALKHHNEITKAHEQFARIAKNRSFYGLLAREALPSAQRPALPSIQKEPVTVSETRQTHYNEDPSFIRARTFYAMNLYSEGHREWNWALRKVPRSQWTQVAHLAGNDGNLHRMINTSLKAHTRGDFFDQRFPMPYRSTVELRSQEAGIPTSWTYGIIRQESRFMERVHSGVGAVGLMQIMPQTGHWLAKKIEYTDFKSSTLIEPDVNVRLGTQYLAMLRENFEGDTVLATAAYNAGPRRASAWRAQVKAPMDSAIFIESIPFYETRGYVKNVFFNRYLYAQALGETMPAFTELVGKITPKADHPSPLP